MTDAQNKQPKAPQRVGIVPSMTSDQPLNTKPLKWTARSGAEARAAIEAVPGLAEQLDRISRS